MRIELRKNMVYLFTTGATSPIDFFRKKDIGRVLDGSKVSEYVFLLSRKSWMDKYTLYRLAQIIQRQFPKNQIDWRETFYPIEEKRVIKEILEEYRRSLNSKDSISNSIMENWKLERELVEDKEVQLLIKDKLKVNLRHYGLS